MSATDWQEIIGTIGVFSLIAIVIVVSIWQFASTRRAKIVLARESEYRRIADKSLLVQESVERHLAELGGRVAEMQTRMQTLERLLKEVE